MNQIKGREYIQALSPNGEYIDKKIDRKEAHDEGLLHKSVHVRAVDSDKEKYNGDIGVYVSSRAVEKSFYGQSFLERTAGGHMDYNEDTTPFADKFEQFPDKISLATFIRETQEELGISLNSDVKIQDGVEIKDFDIIGNNIKYYSEKSTIKEGVVDKKINNELVDIYMIEMAGELKNFDRGEIQNIQIIPSKEILKMLDTQPEKFGIFEEHTRKAKMIKYVIYQLQKRYGVKRI